MTLVLDTNVFVSAVFFTGPPLQILNAWIQDEIQLLLSPEILTEYQRVSEKLHEKFPEIDITPILALVAKESIIVEPAELSESVCADPDDDKFIATALSGSCSLIVSGDKHLLDVSGYEKIRILKPREFVDEFLG